MLLLGQLYCNYSSSTRVAQAHAWSPKPNLSLRGISTLRYQHIPYWNEMLASQLDNDDSSRNNILCMGSLTALSFSNGFHAFFPTPSRFKICSTYTSFTNLAISTLPFSKERVSSGDFILCF
jgi:hypothetical protein